MTATTHGVSQRSPEWRTLRLGRLTGSRAADMLATLRSGKGEAAGRRNLRVQLVLERITGRSLDRDFLSQAMQDGIDREADATLLYEALTGILLTPMGFVSHDTAMAGFSPDGVIGDFEGFVEVKSPIPATHLEYLRTGVVPSEYAKQITHGFWITGAQWCDWLSYNPDFPESLRTRLVRVERDDDVIADYEKKALAFLAEVDRECEAVKTMASVADQLRASLEVA